MAKYKTALIVNHKPFAAEGKDIHETMENIKDIANHLEMPLSKDEEFETMKDLAALEHKGENANLKIAGRPISVVITFETLANGMSFGCGIGSLSK